MNAKSRNGNIECNAIVFEGYALLCVVTRDMFACSEHVFGLSRVTTMAFKLGGLAIAAYVR